MVRWRLITWTFFGLSTAFHFYFPFLTLFLIEAGFSSKMAPILLSCALFFSTMMLPLIGDMLDNGRYTTVLSLSFLGVLVGLGGFLYRDHVHSIAYLISAILFVIGTSSIYSSARRITEGLAEKSERTWAASTTYFVENAGLGLSALLAYFFISQFKKQLIIFDILTTFILCAVLIYIHTKIHRVSDVKKASINWFAGFSYIKQFKKEFLVIFCILVTVFAHFSALQTFFYNQKVDSKEYVGLLRTVNTLTVFFISLLISKKILKLSYKRDFTFAAFIVGLGYLLYLFPISKIILIASTILWSVGESLVYPLITTKILGHFANKDAGLSVGVKDFAIRIALISSPLITGLVNSIDYKLLPYVFGMFPLVSIILLMGSNGQE